MLSTLSFMQQERLGCGGLVGMGELMLFFFFLLDPNRFLGGKGLIQTGTILFILKFLGFFYHVYECG